MGDRGWQVELSDYRGARPAGNLGQLEGHLSEALLCAPGRCTELGRRHCLRGKEEQTAYILGGGRKGAQTESSQAHSRLLAQSSPSEGARLRG